MWDHMLKKSAIDESRRGCGSCGVGVTTAVLGEVAVKREGEEESTPLWERPCKEPKNFKNIPKSRVTKTFSFCVEYTSL